MANWFGFRLLFLTVILFVFDERRTTITTTAQNVPLKQYFDRCVDTEECEYPLVCRYFLGTKYCLGGNPRPQPTPAPVPVPPTTDAPVTVSPTTQPVTSTPSTAPVVLLKQFFDRCVDTEECEWPLVCRYIIGILPNKFCLGGNPRPKPTPAPVPVAPTTDAPVTLSPIGPPATSTPSTTPTKALKFLFGKCTDTSECRPPLVCRKPNTIFRRRCYPPIYE